MSHHQPIGSAGTLPLRSGLPFASSTQAHLAARSADLTRMSLLRRLAHAPRQLPRRRPQLGAQPRHHCRGNPPQAQDLVLLRRPHPRPPPHRLHGCALLRASVCTAAGGSLSSQRGLDGASGQRMGPAPRDAASCAFRQGRGADCCAAAHGALCSRSAGAVRIERCVCDTLLVNPPAHVPQPALCGMRATTFLLPPAPTCLPSGRGQIYHHFKNRTNDGYLIVRKGEDPPMPFPPTMLVRDVAPRTLWTCGAARAAVGARMGARVGSAHQCLPVVRAALGPSTRKRGACGSSARCSAAAFPRVCLRPLG